jgi:hypothetical protein
MRTFKAILAGTLFTVGAAYAGLLYVELPPEYPASMVLDPALGDSEKINDFLLSELRRLPEPNGDLVVRYTKNGELLTKGETARRAST